MSEITLEKLDQIIERTNVTYGEAKKALEQSEGNVIDAIIYIEENFNTKSKKKTKKEENKVDKHRRTYYEFYTDNKWGGRKNKDLVINSSVLGIDGTVDFIKEFVERRFNLK